MIGAVPALTVCAILMPLFDRLRVRPKAAQTLVAESASTIRRVTMVAAILRRNVLVFGVGGLIAPFVGIKLIDLLLQGVGY